MLYFVDITAYSIEIPRSRIAGLGMTATTTLTMNPTYNRNQIGDRPLTVKEEIYKENILDHYREPHNFGEMSNADIQHREFNPLCGDEITVFMHCKGNRVSQITFSGHGCAISQAAMSMLTDTLTGKTLKDIEKVTPENVLKMLGIPIGVVRMKCAILGLKTVHRGISEYYKS